MGEFVFATYVMKLKDGFKETIANENLIGLLYDSIVIPLALEDRLGGYITIKKESASKLINRHDNVSPKIRQEAGNKVIKDSIVEYFEDQVLPELLVGYEDELIHRMKLVIDSDKLVSETRKKELTSLAQKSTLASFLANAFLYVITRENKLPKDRPGTQTKKEDGAHERYKRNQLGVITPPVKVAKQETPYVAALMEAYGEVTSVKDFSAPMLASYPKHKKHFIRQRGYYYLAEAVRRGTRDIYSENDVDQFQVLKNETLEGVIEVWEDNYDNGLSRLRCVMAQAAVIRVDRCWLSRDTDWIGNSQKKGVCHFLVADNRLEGWVQGDD